MSYDSSNIFAKILRGEIPSHKVFETEHCVAILDAFPMAEGHSLLLPKAPCISVLDMSADVAAHVLSQLPRLAKLVQAATGAPGVNILQNSGAVAGQVVFHCHFHVIPRFEGDKAVVLKKGVKLENADAVLARMKGAGAPYAASLGKLDALVGDLRDANLRPAPGAPPAAAAGGKPAAAAAPPKPKAEKSSEKPKAKGGEAKEAAAGGGGDDKAAKKEAKEKAKAAAAAKGKGGAPAADRDVDVSWSEVRVGVILDAKPHPESDKLYVETIDLGEGTPRTVLSGLAQHMTLDQVKGARVVCICNLKPRKMAGIESQAMVLCASDADKSKLAFVEPPAGAAPGDLVTWEGFPGAPETAKKMDKKKAWESIQPCFATDGKGVATYKGAPFAVAGGVCAAPSVFGGIIS